MLGSKINAPYFNTSLANKCNNFEIGYNYTATFNRKIYV